MILTKRLRPVAMEKKSTTLISLVSRRERGPNGSEFLVRDFSSRSNGQIRSKQLLGFSYDPFVDGVSEGIHADETDQTESKVEGIEDGKTSVVANFQGITPMEKVMLRDSSSLPLLVGSVALRCKVMVMGHEDQSLLPFFTEPEEQIHDFLAGFVIRFPDGSSARIIGGRDGPGNGHALAFASRRVGK